jgi:hypothetical protein
MGELFHEMIVREALMLILNFTHPLTAEQRTQIERLADNPIEEVHTMPVQIFQEEPFELPEWLTVLLVRCAQAV